jgi:hypothetical protein
MSLTMPPRKHPLQPGRVRRPPREGWSWIDRRFVREKATRLDRDAILLYFFLAAVSDKDGLSFWGDDGIAAHTRLSASAIAQAREELERQDLIAYDHHLYQVLSIAVPVPVRRESGPDAIGDILRRMADERQNQGGDR